MKIFSILITLLLLAPALHAGPRTSADYSITTDTMDAAGQRTASASGVYGNDGSAGAVVGVSSASGGVVKNGFIGQLYELLGYGLLATNYYPEELGTTQVITVRTADDGTNLIIPPDGITFSIGSGPLSSVSATGLVTAGAVYQQTAAEVWATSPAFPGITLTLPLFVQDTIPDNFGSYANDGIPDSWQFQYFGLDNPLAAPGADASGTGQTNLLKYLAGLDPTLADSRLLTTITKSQAAGNPILITLSKVRSGVIYSLQRGTTLAPNDWSTLESRTFNSIQFDYIFVDPAPPQPRAFYRVQLEATP